jgi:hypothetical protein
LPEWEPRNSSGAQVGTATGVAVFGALYAPRVTTACRCRKCHPPPLAWAFPGFFAAATMWEIESNSVGNGR